MKFVSIVTFVGLTAPAVTAFAPSSSSTSTIIRNSASSTTKTTDPANLLRVSSSDEDKAGLDFSFVTDAVERAKTELPNYDAAAVQQNLQQGELGQRGEVYFAAQALLVGAIFLGGIPLLGDPLRFVLAPVLLLGGTAIGVLSITDLGSDSLSPFPKPTESSSLKTTGLYSQMRHPMYTALLSVMLGLAMATDSIDRLLLTGVLWYVLEIKTEKEESFLTEVFGSEYSQYQTSVPQKFLPMGLLKIMPWTD